MSESKLIVFVVLIVFCVWIIISEIITFNKEYPKADDFTKSSIKIYGRFSLWGAIIALISLLYLFFKSI